MQVERLHVRNFKSIKDLDLEIKGRSLFIMGDNGAGKSTFIQSIYGPLTGKDIPTEAITKGKKDGEITVTIKDENGEEYEVTTEFDERSGSKGRLTVKSKDGRKISSPRSFLDSIVGRVAFDPFEDFIDLKMEKKVQFIKELIGVNFDELDTRQKTAYDDRTHVNRTVKDLEGVIANSGLSETEIKLFSEKKDLSEITNKMQEAQNHNAAKQKYQNEVDRIKSGIEVLTKECDAIDSSILEIEEEIKRLQERIEIKKVEKVSKRTEIVQQEARLKEGQAHIEAFKEIDMTELQEKYEEAVQFNKKAESVQKLTDSMEQMEIMKAKSKALTETIEQCKKEKLEILQTKKMPIPGLTLEDDTLMLEGLPFEKEQIPMSKIIMAGVDLMMATNPKVKIARIKDGSLLGGSNRREIIERCQELGFQVFIEIVDDTKEGVAVEFIED